MGRYIKSPVTEEDNVKVMNVTTKFLRRDPADVQPWTETCGQIRPLIEAADGAAAEVHYVEIEHAKLHYHKQTDEIYYIIDGCGTMVLDEEEIELHRGVVVYGCNYRAASMGSGLVLISPVGLWGESIRKTRCA